MKSGKNWFYTSAITILLFGNFATTATNVAYAQSKEAVSATKVVKNMLGHYETITPDSQVLSTALSQAKDAVVINKTVTRNLGNMTSTEQISQAESQIRARYQSQAQSIKTLVSTYEEQLAQRAQILADYQKQVDSINASYSVAMSKYKEDMAKYDSQNVSAHAQYGSNSGDLDSEEDNALTFNYSLPTDGIQMSVKAGSDVFSATTATGVTQYAIQQADPNAYVTTTYTNLPEGMLSVRSTPISKVEVTADVAYATLANQSGVATYAAYTPSKEFWKQSYYPTMHEIDGNGPDGTSSTGYDPDLNTDASTNGAYAYKPMTKDGGYLTMNFHVNLYDAKGNLVNPSESDPWTVIQSGLDAEYVSLSAPSVPTADDFNGTATATIQRDLGGGISNGDHFKNIMGSRVKATSNPISGDVSSDTTTLWTKQTDGFYQKTALKDILGVPDPDNNGTGYLGALATQVTQPADGYALNTRLTSLYNEDNWGNEDNQYTTSDGKTIVPYASEFDVMSSITGFLKEPIEPEAPVYPEKPNLPEIKKPSIDVTTYSYERYVAGSAYVDESGAPLDLGEQNSGGKINIPGYFFMKVEKNDNGDASYIYHKIRTNYVDQDGKTIKASVDGEYPNDGSKIKGYTYVSTSRSKANGDVTNVYKKIKATNPIASTTSVNPASPDALEDTSTGGTDKTGNSQSQSSAATAFSKSTQGLPHTGEQNLKEAGVLGVVLILMGSILLFFKFKTQEKSK